MFYSRTEIKQPNNKVSGTFSIYMKTFASHFPVLPLNFHPHFRQRNNSSHREDVIAAQETETQSVGKDRRNSCSLGKKPPTCSSPRPVHLASRYISEFLISRNFTPARGTRVILLSHRASCIQRRNTRVPAAPNAIVRLLNAQPRPSFWKYTGRFVLIPCCQRDSRESVKGRCTRLLSRVVRLLAISRRASSGNWQFQPILATSETIEIRVSLIPLAISR